jgi:hypothetical protein
MWDDYHEDTLVIFLEPGKIARIEYYLYKKGSEYQTSTINEIGSFGYEGCAYSMQDELGEIYNSMKDVEFSKIYQDKEAFDGAKYVVIKNFTPFDVQIEYTYKEYVEE